ncbi:MAG: hypothetical protein KDK66_06940 [Deltaproteobacteria bacterium]|nr:hypothetical protein [Deltaproteobacteria bacterium]
MEYTCPICGYPNLEENPRSEADGPSYEICPCCAFEFGYDDDDQGYTYDQWREEWISAGMPWRGSKEIPQNWDPKKQLENLKKISLVS